MPELALLFGRESMRLRFPETATPLCGPPIPTLADPAAALGEALDSPIGAPSLTTLLRERSPRSVVITISDITRPVPNEVIVRGVLDTLAREGIPPARCAILVGTGMHRPSTDAEKLEMLGPDILRACKVIDHRADDAASLARVCDDPPVSVCRAFVEADFRIVTGLLEPHFMAGFSGGRKGICPALVDLKTIERFHGYATLADPRATSGVVEGNPCHAESLRIAKSVGCDFLINVAIDRQRRPAAFFAGHLETAHAVGCRRVAEWNAASVAEPFDLVVTSGGGYPLDQTYYQTVKGMVAALPALGPQSTLLIVSDCGEGVGSRSYENTLNRWGRDWRGFLAHIAATPVVEKDQWQFQMQARVAERVGPERILLATDRFDAATLAGFGVTAVSGHGAARERAQRYIDAMIDARPDATIAVIPEGPYTMLTASPVSSNGTT